MSGAPDDKKRALSEVDEDISTAADQSPPKKQKPTVLPPWSDIPQWTSDVSPIMGMPLEIWDKIFGVGSNLGLQDHMAMAGTCRQVRMAYTEAVWKALVPESANYYYIAKSQRLLANSIFSTASNPPEESTTAAVVVPVTQTYQETIAERINHETINFTKARSAYKITEKQIMRLHFVPMPNPHGRRLSPMKLFRVAQVRALALRVHGGLLGHKAHLQKLANTTAKARETREKNGTSPVKKRVQCVEYDD